MTEPEILEGAIGAVIYQNYENGYSVLRLQCSTGQTVTVVGTIPLPIVGEQLVVTGRWSEHSSYGRQFEAEFLERLMPQSATDILRYLSSRAVKGIGPVLAGRIVNRFQEDTLHIMEKEPERLSEVPGISPAKAKAIGESFRLQVGMRQLLEFFALHHLPSELAVKVYKLYGENAVSLLYDDPYLLMDEGLDAPFGAVDHFAVSLGMAADDPRRAEAGLLFELRYNLSAGHSFLPRDKLIAATAQLLTIDPTVAQEAAERLLEAQRLEADTLAGISVLYLPELYEAECFCTRKLLELSQKAFPAPSHLKAKLRHAEAEGGLTYSSQQLQALTDAATSGLLIITGGPGTGKTTVVNGILSLYQQMGLKCLLAAPTGRASKRLTEVTGQEASTIHRLLEATIDPHTGDMFFLRDGSTPLKAQVVIVDEMSMVDISLFHALLEAIPHNCRLILVGDPDQLPPVGPGFPFRDMLRSGCIPAVRLTEIFRQAQESLIVMNAHRVNQGNLPELRDTTRDFFFLPAKSPEQVAATIVGLCTTRLPQRMHIPAEQIQVLSPTKKGPAGTAALNVQLQQQLNPPAPGKKEKAYGQTVFREGDRVMQVRNNYDLLWTKTDGSAVGTGIFNGDVGTIRSIDLQQEVMTVVFDDREAEYDFTLLNELELAYAITVHKSQGSEYRAVVLSAWNGSAYLLNRRVLYTAITRARELLIIVGQGQTIAAMVQNANVGKRYTGLKLRLEGAAHG